VTAVGAECTIVFRFPPGPTEYRLLATAPKVGDRYEHGGLHWIVDSLETTSEGEVVVTLLPVDAPEPSLP
jgi:hypothetical protein